MKTLTSSQKREVGEIRNFVNNFVLNGPVADRQTCRTKAIGWAKSIGMSAEQIAAYLPDLT